MELTISGYNSGESASSPVELPRLIPAIAANAPMPPVEDLLPVSGASVTLVEYSLGILKATTSPTNTATPQTFNTSLRPAQTF